MQPQLSVIIPTHKRAKILAQCLDHLDHQTVAHQIEVIVVSDGHDDATEQLFGSPPWHFPLRFVEIPKSQQGIARNRGVQLAKGAFVLFVGDDIFLDKDACEKHLEAHSNIAKFPPPRSLGEHPSRDGGGVARPNVSVRYGRGVGAVLGFTTWDPAVGITPVMRWLERSGWQFGYPMIKKHAHNFVPASIQHQFTYTSHISLPTEVAKKFPFREDVSLYGWEDIEWGMRLREAGIKLFYEPDATALHHHHITLEQSLERMHTLGKSAHKIGAAITNFDRIPRGWKLLGQRCEALLPTIRGCHRRAFLSGLAHASVA